MADESSKPENENPTPKPGRGKLLIGGFISLVIIAETVIFFVMVPSGDQIAALAEERLVDSIQTEVEEAKLEKEEDENRPVEFDLGQYGVTFTPPGADRVHSVEFKLFGTVKSKDKKRMEELFAEYQGRFRARMILDVRNSTMDELNENQLGLILRRILATSTDLFGEPILLSVGFNDYRVMEN